MHKLLYIDNEFICFRFICKYWITIMLTFGITYKWKFVTEGHTCSDKTTDTSSHENFLRSLISAIASCFRDGTAEKASKAESWSVSNVTKRLSPNTKNPFNASAARPPSADAYPIYNQKTWYKSNTFYLKTYF